MIEYRIHDTETGEEHTGTAESVMLFADGLETTNGGPKQGTNMAGYFGLGSGVIGMVESLKRSSLNKDGVPFRSFISSVHNIMSDLDFQKQAFQLFLGDTTKALRELAEMAAAKMWEDTNE